MLILMLTVAFGVLCLCSSSLLGFAFASGWIGKKTTSTSSATSTSTSTSSATTTNTAPTPTATPTPTPTLTPTPTPPTPTPPPPTPTPAPKPKPVRLCKRFFGYSHGYGFDDEDILSSSNVARVCPLWCAAAQSFSGSAIYRGATFTGQWWSDPNMMGNDKCECQWTHYDDCPAGDGKQWGT